MILFEKQFHERNAIVDINTTNLSFLKIAEIYRQMGIKNNKFMLSLYDKELIGRDPHNLNDPSLELRVRVKRECTINPWYCFREVMRIPAKGSKPIPYRLSRGNCPLIWAFYNNINTILVQPRQTGKTMAVLSIFAQLLFIYGRNLEMDLLTITDKLKLSCVSDLKAIKRGLPDYLVYETTKDVNNKESISYARYENVYRTMLARSDKVGADHLGRGISTSVIHMDEIGMFKNLPITYPAMVSSTNAARESAKANKQPYCILHTTTSGMLDTDHGRFAHNMILKAMPFSEKLFDLKDVKETKELIEKSSMNNMLFMQFSYLQLGKTHEWFKRRASEVDGPLTLKRDYLNQWIHGATKSILSDAVLEDIKKSEMDPLFSEIEEPFIIRWYVDEYMHGTGYYNDKELLLGMDSSENVGADFTSFVIMDPVTMDILATFRCNESNIYSVAKFILNLLLKYKKMLFIPESNSTGRTIIDYLIEHLQNRGENPFKRIYNEVVQQLHDKDGPKYDIYSGGQILSGTIRKYFGYRTTAGAKGRNMLYKKTFMKAMSMNKDKIKDNTLITEISGLISKNGRVDHATDGHDDLVIAYLLCCYLIYEGENLDIYGLSVDTLAKDVIHVDADKEIEIARQKNLRDEIKSVEQAINSTSSVLIRANLVGKLTRLTQMLDNSVVIPTDNISKAKIRKEDREETVNNFDMKSFRKIESVFSNLGR